MIYARRIRIRGSCTSVNRKIHVDSTTRQEKLHIQVMIGASYRLENNRGYE